MHKNIIGVKYMKIDKVIIDKLHNMYDYEVNFNKDVTFLYGANGCGKTTILTIITYIITGELYYLFQYNFQRIQLTCSEDISLIKKNENDSQLTFDEMSIKSKLFFLTITNGPTDKKVLYVSFNGSENILSELNIEREPFKYQSRIRETYFSAYKWLYHIKSLFNYIYLPLERYSGLSQRQEENEYDDYFIGSFSTKKRHGFNISLNQVEEMIKDKYTKIMTEINSISEQFRNSVFEIIFRPYNEKITFRETSLIGLSNDKIIEFISDSSETIGDDFEQNVNAFFKGYQEFKKEKDGHKDPQKFVYYYVKALEIQNIFDSAKEAVKIREELNYPNRIFIEVVNNFYQDCDVKKTIKFLNNGSLKYTIYNSHEELMDVDIEYLSSGEKQILVFFAHLIYGLNERTNGIYVIDEPELSLHVAWQRKFVKSILEINPSLQLILATHSPEIIGRYKKNAEPLKPILNP